MTPSPRAIPFSLTSSPITRTTGAVALSFQSKTGYRAHVSHFWHCYSAPGVPIQWRVAIGVREVYKTRDSCCGSQVDPMPVSWDIAPWPDGKSLSVFVTFDEPRDGIALAGISGWYESEDIV